MKTVRQTPNHAEDAAAFKRVVVAIDGSDLSREAFAYGAMIAKAADIEIHALHVWEAAAGGLQDLSWEPSIVQRQLSQLAVPLQPPGQTGVALAYRVVEDCRAYCLIHGIRFSASLKCGPLLSRLLELEADELLAVGKGRFADAGLGSTTRRLLQHAVCPVMIVAGPLRTMSRVITIFDGTAASNRAATVAQTLARQTQWPLSVLVVSNPDALSATLQAAQDQAPDSQVLVYGPVDGSSAAQIEHAADKVRSGLVIAPAFSDSWFHQLFLGGTTGHVLAHLHSPLVLVH